MRIGSLFSGAGGLDMAVQAVFGGDIAWHCENDAAASRVLKHRWPDVPNLHDITAVDWDAVESVDVLCGGWPCQPFSLAGKRKGADDDRALWPYVAGAVRMVRPRYVVLENVSAVLGPEFQRVADDLAACGYDIAWTCLRASDVGAPHRRERVFIVAQSCRAAVGESARGSSEEEAGEQAGNRSGNCGGERLTGNRWPTSHTPRDGRHEGRPEPARLVGGSDAAVGSDGLVDLLPTPRRTDFQGKDELLPTPRASERERHTPSLVSVDHYLPTPAASDGTGGGQHPDRREGHTRQLCDYALLLATPSASDGAGGKTSRSGDRIGEPLLGGQAREMATEWGKYEPAIRRWEQVTRPAPAPTEPNSKGNARLSAAFSEWLMGWPAGHVTQVPGISRNDALRIIGNGVVPRQCEAAIRYLLSVACEVVA